MKSCEPEKKLAASKGRRTDCYKFNLHYIVFRDRVEHLDNCTEQEIREVAESEAMVNESTSVYHED